MIYRRHRKNCPHKGRDNWCNSCPIWVDFWENDIRVHKSTKVTDSGPLEEFLIHGSETKFRASSPPKDESVAKKPVVETKLIALDEAWGKFLVQARNRRLSRSAIYCFRQLDLAPFDLLFWPHPLVIHHSAPGRSGALRRP
jgi:hypothetical protein